MVVMMMSNSRANADVLDGGSGLSEADVAALARMREVSAGADPLRYLPDVPPSRIPRHVAIIMDGNGRWATQRGLPRVYGHRNGAPVVREVLNECGNLGVEVLTLYSFSMENWRRPAEEVEQLMRLYVAYMDGEREALVRENIRFRQIGMREGLPEECLAALERTLDATAGCTGPTLCLAVNYSSRAEIAEAARSAAAAVARGEMRVEDVDEGAIEARLWTAGLPDPDVLIRTAGEMRVSNYLLWQISYAELVVTPVLWPDFGAEGLREAVREYAGRSRRFGGVV